MIQSTLVFIKQKLDQYLVNLFTLDENITVLNHLVNQDGSYPQKNKNKMVLTLINLDHGTDKQSKDAKLRAQDNAIGKINPPTRLNIDLLFTASFDDYEQALKVLNATITFFQSNNSFNAKTAPDIPSGIKTLNFDIENISYLEIQNLWSAMGAKYQPSIIYKIRAVTVQNNDIEAIVNPATE